MPDHSLAEPPQPVSNVENVVKLTYSTDFDKLPHSPSSEPITDERIVVDNFDTEHSSIEDMKLFFLTKANETILQTLLNSKFFFDLQNSPTWKLFIPPTVYEFLKYTITKKPFQRHSEITSEFVGQLQSCGKIIVLPVSVAFSLKDLNSGDKHFVVFLSTWGLIQQILLISYEKISRLPPAIKPGPVLSPWQEINCQFIGDKLELPEIKFEGNDDSLWEKFIQFLTTLEDIRRSLHNNLVRHCKIVFDRGMQDKLKHVNYLKRLYETTRFKIHVSPEFEEFVNAVLPDMEEVVTSQNSGIKECKFHYDCSKYEVGTHSQSQPGFDWRSLLMIGEIRVGFAESTKSEGGTVFFLPDVF